MTKRAARSEDHGERARTDLFSRALLLGALLLGALLSAQAGAAPGGDEAPPEARAERSPTTVILVRHAEKEEEPADDPPLKPEGEARAARLGAMLERAGVTRVYSTDTLRTRQTAERIAEVLGLPAPRPPQTVLPPLDVGAMAEALAAHPGEVVVSVGHSNTLGEVAERLGAAPLEPIPESDFGGLYVLTLHADGVSTLVLRQPEPPADPET